MKLFKLIVLILAGTFTYMNAPSQNVLLNILTQNSGKVNQGGTVFLEVSVCNTDPAVSVQAYKLRPQISVPATIVSIPVAGHVLPSGWTITTNNGSTINLSNGTDMIPANTCRTILILLQANALGGPSTVSGQLSFSNGMAPGSAAGAPTARDSPADNISTSTITSTR